MTVNDQLSFLSSCLQRGTVRWFIGAGMSMEAGLPSGTDLAREIESGFGLPRTDLSLQEAAQEAYDRVSGGDVRAFVAERMRGASPTQAHETLAELTPERVYTTNYDCLLERVLSLDEYLVWAKDSDLARTGIADYSGIYKLHGCIDRAPEQMVIASSDYEDRLLGPDFMKSTLKADVPGHNFIFVGYSLADPYLRQLFQEVATTLGRLAHRSWVVDPGTDGQADAWLSELNIQPIPLTAQEFFDELRARESISTQRENLKPAAAPQRIQVSMSPPHFRRDRFIDREEQLGRLESALEQHQGVVIIGQPQIGKRQLALAFLNDASRPQDEQAWLEAEEGTPRLAQIDTFKATLIEEVFGLPNTPEPPPRLFAVVHTPDRETTTHALAALSEVSEVTAGQFRWLLLTQELSGPVPSDVDVLSLGELAPADAAAVVTGIAPALPDEAAATLADIIGGVPGLLADAARIAARESVSDDEEAERVARQVLQASGPEIIERIVGTGARDQLARLALLHLPFHRLTAEIVLCTDRAKQVLSALLDAELLIENEEGEYEVPERVRTMLSDIAGAERTDVAKALLTAGSYDARWPIEALLQFIDARDGEAILAWLREWAPAMTDWGLSQVIAPTARALSETPPEWFSTAADDAVQWAHYLAIRAETAEKSWGDLEELSELEGDVASPSVLHGLVTNMLGIWQHNQGQLHTAAGLFESAISEFSNLGEVTLREQTEHNLALVLADQGHRAEAREMLLAVYESAAERGRADSGGTALGMVGKLEAEDGDLDDAIPHLREAIRLLGRYGSVGASGTLRYDLAVAYSEQENWAESERWLKSALGVLAPVATSRWFGQSIVLLTSVLIKRTGVGGTEQALDRVRQCLARIECEQYHVYAVLQAAHEAMEAQNPDLARDLIERATETAIVEGNPQVCANAVGEAVKLLLASGMGVGIEHITAALGVIAEEEAEAAIRLALDTMALLVEHGQHLWLTDLARRAARVARGTDDLSLQAQTMGNIGAVFRDAEDVQRARRWFRKALAIYEEIGSSGAQAVALHEIGNSFAETNQWKRAMRHYDRAFELASAADDREVQFNIRVCVAELERRRGAPERAIDEGLSIIEDLPDSQPERKAFAAHNLSLAYIDRGEREEAVEWNQRTYDWAEEAGDASGMIKTLRSTAIRKLDEGEMSTAISMQKDVRDMAREAGLFADEILALQEIADIANMAGDDEAVSGALQEAFDLSIDKGNWRIAAEVATQAAVVFAQHEQWDEAGNMFVHGLVASAAAGGSSEQLRGWQRMLLQTMGFASSVEVVDKFERGATETIQSYRSEEPDELLDRVAELVGLAAESLRSETE